MGLKLGRMTINMLLLSYISMMNKPETNHVLAECARYLYTSISTRVSASVTLPDYALPRVLGSSSKPSSAPMEKRPRDTEALSEERKAKRARYDD